MLRKFGNLQKFSQQGFEAKLQFLRKIYIEKASKNRLRNRRK